MVRPIAVFVLIDMDFSKLEQRILAQELHRHETAVITAESQALKLVEATRYFNVVNDLMEMPEFEGVLKERKEFPQTGVKKVRRMSEAKLARKAQIQRGKK